MGNTWVTDLQHFLEDGRIVPEMPTPAVNLVLYMGSIVAWMTGRKATGVEQTNVPCRRSPGRRRCGTEIEAVFENSGTAIAWRCPTCGDNGYIYGWQGTQWDRRLSGHSTRPPVLEVIEGLGAKVLRQRIRPEDRVSVRFTASDRQILEDLVLDPDYLERLHPSGHGFVGEYTLDDLEDILGYVAAEANHTTSSKRRRILDNLFRRLMEIQRSYDDGSWNDSET